VFEGVTRSIYILLTRTLPVAVRVVVGVSIPILVVVVIVIAIVVGVRVRVVILIVAAIVAVMLLVVCAPLEPATRALVGRSTLVCRLTAFGAAQPCQRIPLKKTEQIANSCAGAAMINSPVTAPTELLW